MNLKLSWVLIIFTSITIIAIFVFYFLLKRSEDYKVIKNDNFILDKKYKDNFNIYNYNKDSISTDYINKFPYDDYLNSANWSLVSSIKRHYFLLCQYYGDSIVNQQVLSLALTNKLNEKLIAIDSIESLDSMLAIIEWAEKFNYFSEFDLQNALLYQSIYSYWMNYISNNLCRMSDADSKIKSNPLFRYINFRLEEQLYGCAINKSNIEKMTDNFVDRNYSRILNKLWYRTSISQKTLIILFSLYQVYCIYILYSYRKLKKQIK